MVELVLHKTTPEGRDKRNFFIVVVAVSGHDSPSSLPTTFAFGEILSGPQTEAETLTVES